MRVLLTGGGTGGHVYPALALAEAFRAEKAELLYVGMRGGIEERLVPAWGVQLATISAAPLRRKLSLSIVRTIARNMQGIAQAWRIMRDFAPDVVIATGGYVSLPVIAAARLAGRKRARPFLGLVEPNTVPGLTNRLLAPLVDEVWGGFAEGQKTFGKKFHLTGTPVREELRKPYDREESARALDLDPAKRIILVVGGSQGARTLNAAVAALTLYPLPADRQILHLCGEREELKVAAAEQQAVQRGDVRVIGYLDNPAIAYAAADVVVARAGASTVAELAAAGKPALLVPYPHATADHQRLNAAALVRSGAARMVDDDDLDAARLASELDAMLEGASYRKLCEAARRSAAQDGTASIIARVRRAQAAKGTLS